MKLTQAIIAQLKPQDKRKDYSDDAMKGLFVRVEKSGNKTWYLRYAHSHTIKIGEADRISPAQARDKAQRFLSEYTLNGGNPKDKTVECKTLGQLLTEYEAAGRSKYIIDVIDCTWPRSTQLSYFTKLNIEKWQKKFCESHKIATSNRRIVAMKALLNWGEGVGLCKHTLRDARKLPETDSKTIIRYLTQEESERLMEQLLKFPQVFQAIVLVAVNTGIRKNALLNLKWSDVSLQDKTITLQASNAKNKKSAILPMNQTVYNTLSALPHDSEFIFTSARTGTRYDEIRGRWKTLLKAANIHDFRFHDLRHTFASRLVMKGVDLNTVRELMTHSDIQMTMRYAHLAPNVKKAAVDLLD